MRALPTAGLVAALLTVSVTACTHAARPAQTTTAPERSPPPATSSAPAGPGSSRLGEAGCQPASPRSPSTGGFLQQVEGTGHGATLWGLLFFTGLPRARSQVKIVWRMTGAGPFEVVARGPQGQTVKPAWGPEEHGSSSWDKPGQEWGTSFVFVRPGCWDLHAAREAASGDIWLQVAR